MIQCVGVCGEAGGEGVGGLSPCGSLQGQQCSADLGENVRNPCRMA
jgi:hypothetical protein